MKTHVLLDHEPVPGGRVVRLLLRLEAEPVARADRLPLNLSLVLDRSGSMHGEKLRAARAAAALLVRRLSPSDIVSVVAYDDEVTTIAEPATGKAQGELPRSIERIGSGGSTNLSGGWLRARELVARNIVQQGVNRIVLLTDGLANVGIIDPELLTGLCAAGKATHGITTTTIGFGADYNEKVLRAMADAGGGNMYYIERPDQAPSIFNDELQGLLDLGAQNATVTVVPESTAAVVAVHHDYASTAAGTTLRVELGDLYAREPKPLLVEFLVEDVAAETLVAVLTVTADVLTSDGVEHRVITLPVRVDPGEGARIDPEVRREMLLLEAARARREALELRERGDHDAAADKLSAMHDLLLSVGIDDPELREEASDLGNMSASMALYDLMPADEKYMYQRAYNTSTGRRSKDALIRRKLEEEEPPA